MDDLLVRLQPWASRLPRGGMFGGLAACEAWGLWLPPVAADRPIDVTVPASTRGSRRENLAVARVAHPPDAWIWKGLRVAPLAEAILSSAAMLGVLDTVVLIDSALSQERIAKEELETYADQRRRGVTTLRRALALSDARSESPWESLLRVFHVSIDVNVTPQVDLFAPDDRLIGRADLLIDGTRTLQEYDGAGHLERAQYRDDRRRDSDLAAHAYVRHGWTAPDLTRDYARIMRAADAAVGRTTRASRLESWRVLLRESAYAGQPARKRATCD